MTKFMELTEEDKDKIINPNYYKDIVPGYEYFQVMENVLSHEEFVGLCKGQIFKYMLRLGKKDDIEQDAKKVKWYSAYLAEYLERYRSGKTPYRKE